MTNARRQPTVRRIWESFRRKSPVLGAYVGCFGARRGIPYYVLVELLRRSRGRVVHVQVDDATTVALRLGTSDYRVCNDVFHKRDYDFEFDTPIRSIIDAGAYTGLSTVWFARRFPQAHIIAVEPDPDNLLVLRQNVAGLSGISVVQGALWPTSGTLQVVDPGGGPWSYQIRPEGKGASADGVPRARVAAVSLPELLADHPDGHVDLLKLDIEGAEVEVFRHADPWIAQVEAICLELHDRFRAGCSRAFYEAVRDFPVEIRRGENVLVVRRPDQLLTTAEGATTVVRSA